MAVSNTKYWFSGLFGQNFSSRLTSFISSYGRRMAEPYYDQFAQTEFFQKLKNASKPKRYAMEAVVNALSAILEERIREDTPIRKIAKEIFMDSSSELNKRLLNGESAKKLFSEKSETLDAKGKSHLAALLLLEEDKLDNLLKWILSLDDKDRAEVLRNLQDLDPDEIERLANLSPEARNRLFQTFKKPAAEKSESEFSQNLQSAKKQLDQWLTERLERKRRLRNGRNAETDTG